MQAKPTINIGDKVVILQSSWMPETSWGQTGIIVSFINLDIPHAFVALDDNDKNDSSSPIAVPIRSIEKLSTQSPEEDVITLTNDIEIINNDKELAVQIYCALLNHHGLIWNGSGVRNSEAYSPFHNPSAEDAAKYVERLVENLAKIPDTPPIEIEYEEPANQEPPTLDEFSTGELITELSTRAGVEVAESGKDKPYFLASKKLANMELINATILFMRE